MQNDYSIKISSLTVAEFKDLMKSLMVPNRLEIEPHQQKGKELLTIHEASGYLNLSVATLYSFNSRKKIPYIRKTGKIYYKKTSLDEWLASGERKTNAQLRREAMEGGER